MSLHEKIFYLVVDAFHKIKPEPKTSREILSECKIISHRGEHDNKTVFENTIAAFEKVLAAKVWGIEFDIRWTKDLVPVVFHDADLRRLFRSKTKIVALTFAELREKFPLVPSLAEVVDQFGGKIHLMVEIKKEVYPDSSQQIKTLEQIFSPLTPMQDYHFISIYPEMFDQLSFLPSQALLPVATISYKHKSRISFRKKYGGVLGHYQFLSRYRISRHLRRSHKVGVGFVASKNSLYRELNRGVEWIFSNNAVYLQQIVDRELIK